MSADHVVARWEDGEIVETPNATAVHPTRDGGVIVVDPDGVVQSYGPNGDLLRQTTTGVPFVAETALDPTGSKLILTSDEGRAMIVDIATGQIDDLGVIGRILNFGFDDDAQQVAMAYVDGTMRLWDMERAEPSGVIWTGSGGFPGEPGWYDASSRSVWMNTAGKLVQFPLDPQRWVERACEIVDRELTEQEWDRLVPGDQPQRPACV
jgi:hypothetical protein